MRTILMIMCKNGAFLSFDGLIQLKKQGGKALHHDNGYPKVRSQLFEIMRDAATKASFDIKLVGLDDLYGLDGVGFYIEESKTPSNTKKKVPYVGTTGHEALSERRKLENRCYFTSAFDVCINAALEHFGRTERVNEAEKELKKLSERAKANRRTYSEDNRKNGIPDDQELESVRVTAGGLVDGWGRPLGVLGR